MLAKLQPSDGWVERKYGFKSRPGLLLAINEASKSSRLQPERERLGGSKKKIYIALNSCYNGTTIKQETMDENKKELHEVMLDIKPSKVETPVLLGELDIVMNVVKRQKKQDIEVFNNLMKLIDEIK